MWLYPPNHTSPTSRTKWHRTAQTEVASINFRSDLVLQMTTIWVGFLNKTGFEPFSLSKKQTTITNEPKSNWVGAIFACGENVTINVECSNACSEYLFWHDVVITAIEIAIFFFLKVPFSPKCSIWETLRFIVEVSTCCKWKRPEVLCKIINRKVKKKRDFKLMHAGSSWGFFPSLVQFGQILEVKVVFLKVFLSSFVQLWTTAPTLTRRPRSRAGDYERLTKTVGRWDPSQLMWTRWVRPPRTHGTVAVLNFVFLCIGLRVIPTSEQPTLI